jgi:hypothetical protein
MTKITDKNANMSKIRYLQINLKLKCLYFFYDTKFFAKLILFNHRAQIKITKNTENLCSKF